MHSIMRSRLSLEVSLWKIFIIESVIVNLGISRPYSGNVYSIKVFTKETSLYDFTWPLILILINCVDLYRWNLAKWICRSFKVTLTDSWMLIKICWECTSWKDMLGYAHPAWDLDEKVKAFERIPRSKVLRICFCMIRWRLYILKTVYSLNIGLNEL